MANSPDDENLLDELLSRWEAALANGAPVSPEELCRNHPHFLPRLGEAIAKLQKADAVLGDPPTKSIGADTSPPPSSPMPQSIGPYRILEVLGEGGMGTVYKAEQRAPLKRTVAIKVVKAGFDTAEVLARFQAEHQALARLDHPNIARVFDAGTTELGRPYFVMEYLPGQPITRFCDDNKLSIRQRLELFHQACDALTHAHIKAIVHRDIKSSNVLAFMQDGKPLVKVIDFGIAKALTGDRLTDLTFNTARGVVVGTYDSMSPEQADGSPDIDTRTDVYALGVLLYELLTGAKPFDVKTFAKAADGEIRRIIREVEPPRPSTRFSSLGDVAGRVAAVRQSKIDQLSKELNGDLGWIPLKAMRKERQGRYVSPLQMSEDISNYLSGRPLIAGPVSQIYRMRKFATRNARPLGAASLAVLLLLAATVFFLQSRADRAKLRLAQDLESKQRQLSDANAQIATAQTQIAVAQRQIAQNNLISVCLRQAELSVQRGKWAESLSAYNAAADAGAADSRTILLGRVLSLENQGRTADAQHQMEDAIRAHPELADDPVIMVRRGELLWSTNPAEGERLLRTAIQRGLPPAELAFTRGLLADSIPEAIDQFKQEVAADPFSHEGIGLISILSTILGQWTDAQDYSNAWQRMFPDDPDARVLRAIQFALRGDKVMASKTLDEAVRVIDPKTGAQVRGAVDLLIKVHSNLFSGTPPDLSNISDLVNLASARLNFAKSGLLFPRVLGGCARDLLAGVATQASGNFMQKFGATAAAKAKFGQAADNFSDVEKSLPIGMFFVLRAGALSSAQRHDEAAAEYERAADALSPVDVRGYSHIQAGSEYYSANQAAHKTGPRAVEDPRISGNFLQAAKTGTLGTNEYYWRCTAYFCVVGRQTDDARRLIDLWKAAMPDDPLVGVWEAENEYVAGNYYSAAQFFGDLPRKYPDYDFSNTAEMRSACLKAIDQRMTGPPSDEEKMIDMNFAIPHKPSTRPAPSK